VNELLRCAKKTLVENGFRITPQRKTILRILAGHRGQHLTAESIHEYARQQGVKPGLATVYRTLTDLEKLGLVAKLETGSNPARYELASPSSESHYHLVCRGCGKVIEVDGLIPKELQQAIARLQDFEVSDYAIQIFGYCKDCQQKRQYRNQKYPKNHEHTAGDGV